MDKDLSFEFPRDISVLPPHRADAIDEDQRQLLPLLEWQRINPALPLLRSVNSRGAWMIKAARDEGNAFAEPAHIEYTTPIEEGETYQSIRAQLDTLTPGSVEECFLRSKFHPQEVGYAFDTQYAQTFIEQARRLIDDRSVQEILESAGFARQYVFNEDDPVKRTDVYWCQDSKRGIFSASIRAGSFHLTHEKRSSQYWTNLLRMAFFHTTHDGAYIPVFHSPEIANPLSACANMAVYFTQHWQPKGVQRRLRMR